ncbi:unnamed protein product [Cuscuta campestris]|uniref:Retrotransposon Copia-like N-terminal domain-containing protein n=1 Tax=Cuscuta campestris TaxID=132261 RepID=A0A484L5T9_9ASTE|nr:unnamed protein product [Cuscuta campestris]
MPCTAMASVSSDPMDRLPTGLKLFVRNLQSLTPVKLDDTNYPSWSATVRANLLAHRLLGYVDRSEPSPSSFVLDEKAAAPGKDEPPVMKLNPAYESWNIVDAQIRACLLAIVSPTVQTHIHALPTSAAIWNHLEQRYNSLSRTHIFQLKERLHGVTKGTDSTQSYLDTVLTIVSSLKLAHEAISEQDIILCVLRGLPADYASLKQNIRTNIATVTFNQALVEVVAEDHCEAEEGLTAAVNPAAEADGSRSTVTTPAAEEVAEGCPSPASCVGSLAMRSGTVGTATTNHTLVLRRRIMQINPLNQVRTGT